MVNRMIWRLLVNTGRTQMMPKGLSRKCLKGNALKATSCRVWWDTGRQVLLTPCSPFLGTHGSCTSMHIRAMCGTLWHQDASRYYFESCGNRPFLHSWYWPGTSLQLRLMQVVFQLQIVLISFQWYSLKWATIANFSPVPRIWKWSTCIITM